MQNKNGYVDMTYKALDFAEFHIEIERDKPIWRDSSVSNSQVAVDCCAACAYLPSITTLKGVVLMIIVLFNSVKKSGPAITPVPLIIEISESHAKKCQRRRPPHWLLKHMRALGANRSSVWLFPPT